jgi:hypothetical protein
MRFRARHIAIGFPGSLSGSGAACRRRDWRFWDWNWQESNRGYYGEGELERSKLSSMLEIAGIEIGEFDGPNRRTALP